MEKKILSIEKNYKEVMPETPWANYYEILEGIYVVYSGQVEQMAAENSQMLYDKIIISYYVVKGSYSYEGKNGRGEVINMTVKKGDVLRFAGGISFDNVVILDSDMQTIGIYGSYENFLKTMKEMGVLEDKIKIFYHRMVEHGNSIVNVGDVKFKQIASELIKYIEENNEYLVKVKGMELFYHVVDNVDENIANSKKKYKREYVNAIIKVRETIEADPGKEYAIENMARECNLSPTYFKTIFKESFDETPHSYILRKRMERAEQLLRGKNLSIQKIADALGFTSASKFSADFKKIYSCTPSKYRKEQK